MYMAYDPSIHHRHSIRLQDYDYSLEGVYYVTVCTRNRRGLFGNVMGKEMKLNDAGEMIRSVWLDLPGRFPFINLYEFIIMPNHIHTVFAILTTGMQTEESFNQPCGRPNGTLPGTVGRVIQAFKSITTNEYINGVKQQGREPFKRKLWQRNYCDHIIRDEKDYIRVCEYMHDIPACWPNDPLNST
jgi:REP element-mobilizing transposase RayT